MDGKKPGQKRRRRSGAVPADRVAALLSTFSTLRDDGRALMERIRGSLEEMRELRVQLRNHRGTAEPNSKANLNATRASYLQLQYGLTARETDVAKLLAQGRSNVAIARTMGISAHTARHHTQSVLSKLKVHSRAEAGAKIRG